MAEPKQFDGTKITEIETLPNTPQTNAKLANAKVMIITADNQYLVSMATLIQYIKNQP